MRKSKVLDSSFFNRSTVEVARELIGKWLCRRASESSESFRMRICETEAYDGPDDKACHAHRGKTARNEVMFGPAGHWYVYLCYGMHWMLNAVTGPVGYPGAVLIRGCCGVVGPGRLTKAFSVNRDCDRSEITERSGLWVEDDNFVVNCDEIVIGPRIGIGYAGPEWENKPFRFVWKPPLEA